MAIFRRPDLAEAARLQSIEAEAGRRFASVDMGQVAAMPPMPTQSICWYIRQELAWACWSAGQIVGFILFRPLDGWLYIAEVDVLPAFAGQRLGQRLMSHVHNEAARRAMPGTSLMTFQNVPWNAPYFSRLGYEPMSLPLLPGHGEVWSEQHRAGLDMRQRVVLCRPTDGPRLAPEEAEGR